jgi:hypothetical protein
VTPMCGSELWRILVTSPEILIFALFMIPDPRTVPDGPVARFVFGVVVAILAVLLLGPTALEYWTKTAILASLVIACAGRFALARFVAPFEAAEYRPLSALGARRLWRVPAAIAVAAVFAGAVPVSADISTHIPDAAAELPDGSTPIITLTVGAGPGIAGWASDSAGAALPPAGNAGPVSASARVWILPSIPTPSVASNVSSFDPSINSQAATKMAHDTVLDLIIESEARRTHDLKLAELGARDDGLKEFVDVINGDGGNFVQKTYSFDSISIQLFLPKFATQAARLVGIELRGTATYTTRDASGNVVSRSSSAYDKTWGIVGSIGGSGYQLIFVDYTGLAPAP